MGKRTSDYTSSAVLKTDSEASSPPQIAPKTTPKTASKPTKPALEIVRGGSGRPKQEDDFLSELAETGRAGRQPRNLLHTLRQLVAESEDDGLLTSELAGLSLRWIRDKRHMRGLAEGTLQGYEAAAKRLIWFLETHSHTTCGEYELEEFIAYCRSGRDPDGGRWGHGCTGNRSRAWQMGDRSVRIHYNNIRAFFGWMVKKGHIARSPFDKLEPPKEPQKEIQPFTEAHIMSLLEAARKTLQPKRDVALLLVLLDCGLRADECCSLCHKDLNLEEFTLRVRHGKGNKERTVVFSPLTAAAIWNYLEELRPHPEAALFKSYRGSNAGGALCTRGLHKLFERLGKEAGIGDIRCSPHTMRHAAASFYLMRGGSIEDLRRVLGHSTTRMSSHYVHLNKEHMREQHRRFSPVEGLLRPENRRSKSKKR